MASDWFYFWEKSSCASCAPRSHHSWEDSLTTDFCQCLTLRKVDEYSHVARAPQPMTVAIPLKDTIATLHQLHPLPSYLVPLPIFYYQPEHTFVLNRILFAQALAITPRLFLGGLSIMVYEHLLGCLIQEDTTSRFSKLFQAVVAIICGDIPMSQPQPWVHDQSKGVARLWAKREARESHFMLLGVLKSVKK